MNKVNQARKQMVENTIKKYIILTPETFLSKGFLPPIMIVFPNERDPQILDIPMKDEQLRMKFYDIVRQNFPDAIASIVISEAIVREIPSNHPVMKEFAISGIIPPQTLNLFPQQEVIRIQIERLYEEHIETKEWKVVETPEENLVLSEMETKITPPDQHAMSLIIKRGRS